MDIPTDELKHRARDEGFDLVGIAAAGKAQGSKHLRRWLDRGMHGEMGYMARTHHVRCDPRHLLPECKSVIAVGMSYRCNQPDSTSHASGDGRVWISRYAWGRDYHRILKKKLVRLGHWLADRHRSRHWRACVDTAPILEREWAARAGLGWIGKNTCLIDSELGSHLFLGVVLTDLPPGSEVGRLVRAVIDSARRAAELSGQLLAYAGKGRSRAVSLDLAEHVRSLVPLLESSVSKAIPSRSARWRLPW